MSSKSSMAPGYFGKVPARGDFMKGGSSVQVIARLDRWVSECMHLLSEDPRWRIDFDNMSPVDFAFVAPGAEVAVAGHLQASHDSSRRRFPFLVASLVESPDETIFETAPAAFAGLWNHFEAAVEAARQSSDPSAALRPLASLDCPQEVCLAAQQYFRDHKLDRLTVGDVDRLFEPAVTYGRFRRVVLALGVLLAPIRKGPRQTIEKGLCLPLPAGRVERARVAAIWQHLIAGFFSGTPWEIQILQTVSAGRHVFVVGFNGASPHPLASVICPRIAPRALVSLEDPEWVDEEGPTPHNSGALAKLSSYLADGATPVNIILETFHEVYFGDRK